MGQNALIPIPLDGAWDEAPASLLGSEYQRDSKRYMMVKNAEGSAIAGRLALVWKDKDARTVELADAASEIICGVSPDELAVSSQTVPDGDAFLMQIEGVAKMVHSGGTAATIGDHVIATTTAGKVQGVAAPAASAAVPQQNCGVAETASAGADSVFEVELLPLNLKVAVVP